MRLRAGAQQSVFSHQPLRLAHLVAGSIMEHLAIGGVGAQAPIPRQLLHTLTLERVGLKA